MKRIAVASILMLSSCSFAQTPAEGYIPNTQTAISVARAFLVPIFGSTKAVSAAGPYHAMLERNIWTVCAMPPKRPPKSSYGPVGAYCIQLDKETGAVIQQMPGK